MSLQDDSLDPEGILTEQGELGTFSLEGYLPLLNFLQDHRGELEELLDSSPANQIPHYKFSGGVTVIKSFTMGVTLDQLVRNFSGVMQCVIVEAALIQFTEKYGYARQVRRLDVEAEGCSFGPFPKTKRIKQLEVEVDRESTII